MTILWWQWLLLGLALMVAELATPGGFYLIFFGVGAVVVGTLEVAGLIDSTAVELLLFSVLSVASLLVFRNPLLKRFQPDPQQPPVDQLVGEIGTLDEELAPGQVGRIELRGTAWTGRNRGGQTIARGARVRVVSVDGLTLDVEPEGIR